MAVKTATITSVPGGRLFTWTGVTNADTFEAVPVGDLVGSASIVFGGTFGSATVILNGSNDGTDYVPLTDQAGTAISKTAAGAAAVGEKTRYLKPSASGGGGTQSLTAQLFVARK